MPVSLKNFLMISKIRNKIDHLHLFINQTVCYTTAILTFYLSFYTRSLYETRKNGRMVPYLHLVIFITRQYTSFDFAVAKLECGR